ncbi:NACHT, LRR and PYD domains-containing protein 3-like [Boleophthalmus pectinirostris]|uniref:NACHT, LRR and PYD domains-containing protein 3-like n=1 Tax=Boleophthalmus pectinirostris TaxID=150288 RepID=UPI0024324F56|nr:NACHT, LRR and PYD domains-containing protein 3-like [Boleophthalmus pectinirostris]
MDSSHTGEFTNSRQSFLTPADRFKLAGVDQSQSSRQTYFTKEAFVEGKIDDSAPYGPTAESLTSDSSKDWNQEFKDSHQRDEGPSIPSGQEPQAELDSIFQVLEEQVLRFVQQQLQRLHRLLASNYPECSESEEDESREVLNITLDFLKRMDQEHLAQRLLSRSKVGFRDKLKRHLQQRFSRVFEGVAKAGDSAPLTQIYTELYIIEGGASEVNQEHEVRHMEFKSRTPTAPEITITCEDLFKAHPHLPKPIRLVLTKGVAGVGKTVLTQKFSLDWAEGRANQDFQLLFPFTFRELNVFRNTEFSLVELLHHFFSPSKDLCSFQQLQVLFIFDGLDECRPPLDFSQTQVLTDATESASVHVLLVNLIRGSLLPSAHLWITTRPAAASQIPAECVSMVTEVRGFTDLQKEQYFRKRFKDHAKAVISHIKSIRSLHIMSHIPIFCWILYTVLQKLLKQTEPELPRTLTQMYVHFLVVQAKIKNIKYHEGSGEELHWTPETREMVESLGKLAFEQLQKGNLIFYESDLSECGLDAAAASVYSGVFTQVFREEPGLYQDKVYCFIHLSVQEFLAALHVHQTFYSSGENLLEATHTSESPDPEAFYRSAVDQALQSPDGHLDLFLRFLLGLSLPTNQRLLQGLLTHTESDRTDQETVKYIKQKLDEKGLPSERSLNLLHCLNELNDQSLVQEIQKNMRRYLADGTMSAAQWSALSFVLLSSDSDLKEFDLRKYQNSETALLGLLPVVRASTKTLLCGCGLSPHSCAPLASVLSSSSLTHLDLSHNDLQDSGVELLCSGLKSTTCRLETLSLSGCLVSERGGAALASALSSASSHLTELDLSYNHPGPSAELLTALRDQRPLLLDPAGERWMVPGLRKYSCKVSLDPNTAHRRLLLSEDHRSVTRVGVDQKYEDHEDRFTVHAQVLSRTGLRGRCYWEVDWSGRVVIAGSYKEIRRRGQERECEFGNNDHSWSLRIYGDGVYFVWHKSNATRLHHSERGEVSSSKEGVLSGRVGVFLDSEAGALSFYEVSSDGELFHLWTFSSSFSEPLFPGFALGDKNSSVTLETMGFVPEVSLKSAHVSFRCSSTGLVFVVTKEVELLYRIVQWDEALLESSGRTPAGPLYEIECPEQALCELHLPHCEPEHVDLSTVDLSVAHISDSGLSLMEPEQITQSHVVISVSGLSLFGLLMKFFDQYKEISGQVLLFCTLQEPKVNMFLLPRNISFDQVEKKQRTTKMYIQAPSKCKLVINRRYKVTCPTAKRIQPEWALFDMDNEPNFHPSFEVCLPTDCGLVSISVKEEGSTEDTEVWRYKLDLTEVTVGEDRRPQESPQLQLWSVRPEFVQRVSDEVLKQILDKLQREKVLTAEEAGCTRLNSREDKARYLVDTVLQKGHAATSALIRAFCELDPWSDLCQKLRTEDS